MRRLLTLFFAALVGLSAEAQSLEAFKARLAAPAPSGAKVLSSEYGTAQTAVAQAARNSARSRLRGYRVCIFFDNGQDGRSGAFAAKSLFESTYPGVRVHMVYQTPYYKVTVGDCLTSEEAIILKGKIAGTFPKAFLKSEDLALSDLLH